MPSRALKLLIVSNMSWCHSGYGVMAKYLTKLAQESGFDVAGFANFGLEGAKLTVGGVTWYPTPHDDSLRWRGETARGYARDFGAHLVLGVHDNWHVQGEYIERLDTPWLNWFPIDHTPPSDRVVSMAKQTDWPCVYSQWAQKQLALEGVQAQYIPIGVDTSVFVPYDKQESRALLGWQQDAFVMTMVASNVVYPSRKGYPEAMQVLNTLLHRDSIPDLYLYCHCDHEFRRGVSLTTMAKTLGIESRVILTDRCQYELGYSDQHMARVYSASDLLLMPTRGEGFGMPVLEAQACGCPVIATNFSSMPELVANGQLVPFEQLAWGKLMGWYAVPSVSKFVDAVESEYKHRNNSFTEVTKQAGVNFARQFDWSTIWQDKWLPLLTKIEAELC